MLEACSYLNNTCAFSSFFSAVEFKKLTEADLLLDQKDLELEKENMNSGKDNSLTKRGMIPYARKLWVSREVPYKFQHSGTFKYTSGIMFLFKKTVFSRFGSSFNIER